MKYFLLLFTTLTFFLSACSEQEAEPGTHVVEVAATNFTNSLSYSGTIEPLQALVVPSPADGVVIEKAFQYGDVVKKGQLLFELSSAKFLTDYKTALVQYIKAKSDFDANASQLKEGEFLHKNQLISDDDFNTKKTNFYNARLGLLQAKDSLEELSKQMAIKDMNFINLSIADIDKINQALHLQVSSRENLRVIAPSDGVILSQQTGEESVKKIEKGNVVKQGDVLAVMGNMQGISVRIKVNELTINQLKKGQHVKVTGIAFPDDVLIGKVRQVDKQADLNSNGLPSFSAEIAVPQLTKEQQKNIHVGMSAKVEISIDEKAQIMIPVAAVFDKSGTSFVKLRDAKAIREVAVKTGNTSLDAVTILAGLKAGDKILVPN